MMIPNTWPEELQPVIFDGFFGTAGGYMPWFGQVRGREGYIAICVTPWNAGYQRRIRRADRIPMSACVLNKPWKDGL